MPCRRCTERRRVVICRGGGLTNRFAMKTLMTMTTLHNTRSIVINLLLTIWYNAITVQQMYGLACVVILVGRGTAVSRRRRTRVRATVVASERASDAGACAARKSGGTAAGRNENRDLHDAERRLVGGDGGAGPCSSSSSFPVGGSHLAEEMRAIVPGYQPTEARPGARAPRIRRPRWRPARECGRRRRQLE